MFALIVFAFALIVLFLYYILSLLAANLSGPAKIQTYADLALIPLLIVGLLLIFKVYQKRRLDFENQGLQLQKLIEENAALVKFIFAWLLFTAGAAFAQFFSSISAIYRRTKWKTSP